MALIDSGNARIYGSDDDRVLIGDIGSTLPDDLSEPDAALEDVGWLNDDGLDLNPSDSVETFTGHQGGKVVRKKMTASETAFVFRALETKALTLGLQFQIKEKVITGEGAAKIARSTYGSGRKVVAKCFVIDLFDEDPDKPGVVIHRRFVIPRGEIGERGSVPLKKSAITVYEFTVTIIGDWFEITNDPAVVEAEAA